MKFDKTKPYNDLPLLPPTVEIESKSVLRSCIAANRALAELKGVGELIPNQEMLINAIPLQEARVSSEIENIVTTNDRLYKAISSPENQVDSATKEVLRYRTALKRGSDLIQTKPLSINVVIEVCRSLLSKDVGLRKIPGTFITNPITKEIVYTPPVGENIIRDKLANLEQFIHLNDDLDPVIKLAVMHYQFEAVHPFHDGNGRTGRIINLLYLIEQGLLTLPVLYLSKYIIENKTKYYTLLRNVTEKQQWETWILFMLTAVETTALETTDRIKRINALFERTLKKCREQLPSTVYSKELVEMVFVQPYCKIKFLTDARIARRQTASKYLQELESIDVLKATKAGREVIYINPPLLKILSE
jgi:Fic family protein